MKRIYTSIVLILFFSILTAQEVSKWDFLSVSSQKEQEKLVKSVLKSDISGDSLIKLIQAVNYKPTKEK